MKAVMVVARQRARRRMKVTAARLKRVADADVVVEERWDGAERPWFLWLCGVNGVVEGVKETRRKMSAATTESKPFS